MFNCFLMYLVKRSLNYIITKCYKTTMVKVALNLTYRIQFLQLNKVEEQFQIQTDAQCLIG